MLRTQSSIAPHRPEQKRLRAQCASLRQMVHRLLMERAALRSTWRVLGRQYAAAEPAPVRREFFAKPWASPVRAAMRSAAAQLVVMPRLVSASWHARAPNQTPSHAHTKRATMSSARLRKALSSLVPAMGRRKADLQKKVHRSRPNDACAMARGFEACPPRRPRAACCTLWMKREERSAHIMHGLCRCLRSDLKQISQKRPCLMCACLAARCARMLRAALISVGRRRPDPRRLGSSFDSAGAHRFAWRPFWRTSCHLICW